MTTGVRTSGLASSRWFQSALVAVGYVGAGLFFRRSELGPVIANLLWPPAGMALGVVLLLGMRVWPGIVVGALAELLAAGYGFRQSLGSWAGTIAEILLAGYFLRLVRLRNALDSVGEVFKLVSIAVLGSAFVGSAVNAAYRAVLRRGTWDGFLEYCLSCYRGDALAFLIVTPVILTWGNDLQLKWVRGKGKEALALAGSVILANWAAYGGWLPLEEARFPPHLLFFPSLVWAGMRFGPAGCTATSLVVVSLAARGILTVGTSAAGGSAAQLPFLWAFMTFTSFTAMLFAAVISQRGRAEQELRASEEKFALAFRSSPDPMTITTFPEGEVVEVNDSFLRLYGAPREEIIGRSTRELQMWTDMEKRNAVVRQLAETGEVRDVELEFRGGTGEVRTFRVSFERIQLHGRPCVLSVSRDYTEQRRANQALRASEEKFAKAFHASPNALSISTVAAGRYVEVNESFCRLTGYGREDVVGRTVREIGFWDDPGQRNELVRILREQGAVRDMEIRFRRKSGQVGVALLSADIIVLDDEPCLLAHTIEITERKKAEEALRASEEKFAKAFRSSPTAITIATRDEGRFLEVNDGFLQLTGYTRQEIIGRTASSLNLWEEPEARQQVLAELREQGTVRDREARLRKKSGQIALVVLAAEMIEVGGQPCLLVVSNDVTEQRALEAQLRQAQKMEAIGQLAGGVAHDFNNLLGIIIGYADLLADKHTPDSAEGKKLEQIRHAADRAAGLTRQLLAFSRKQVLQPKVLNLNRIVEEMGKMLRRLMRANIQLVYRLEPKLGCVRADPGQVEQILMNLVVNASDAMENGGTLTIETSNVAIDEAVASGGLRAAPGNYVLLAISDTGVGMDEAIQGRIFEPFFTTKPAGKGTGLGLATVYGIVKQSGGYVWVQSAPNRGSTFRVYLPRVEERAEPEPAVRAKDSRRTARGEETILLVEDEEGVRELMRESLTRAEYTVLSARDGIEGLALYEKHAGKISLVVSDAVLPGMTGRELAQKLVQATAGGKRPKLLFVTGYADEAMRQDGLLAGASLLRKPFRMVEFLECVRSALDGRPAR